MRRFKVVQLYSNYYPEGHPRYNPEHRANALYPGQHKDNNNAENENEGV